MSSYFSSLLFVALFVRPRCSARSAPFLLLGDRHAASPHRLSRGVHKRPPTPTRLHHGWTEGWGRWVGSWVHCAGVDAGFGRCMGGVRFVGVCGEKRKRLSFFVFSDSFVLCHLDRRRECLWMHVGSLLHGGLYGKNKNIVKFATGGQ